MSNKTVQNKSNNPDKMTANKMLETLCKCQNTGYCKYQKRCWYKHVTEKCESTCDWKTCRKRHQQLCKFGLKCCRLETCEYKHETTSEESGVKAQIKDLEVKITKLMEENKNTNEKMFKMESELKSNLKNAVQEGIKKDKIISELKEQLKEKDNANKEQNVKLIKKEQESVITVKLLERTKVT